MQIPEVLETITEVASKDSDEVIQFAFLFMLVAVVVGLGYSQWRLTNTLRVSMTRHRRAVEINSRVLSNVVELLRELTKPGSSKRAELDALGHELMSNGAGSEEPPPTWRTKYGGA